MRGLHRMRCAAVAVVMASAPVGVARGAAPVLALAAEGKALVPVVTAPGASERVVGAARTLADYLGKMSGAVFTVETGDGGQGIAVGTASDFPGLGLGPQFDKDDLGRREEYLLRTHGSGLHVVGAGDLAVEDGIWDLLYRLGYRQFFPGPTWETVPFRTSLSIALDTFQKPSYLYRRIWYNWNLQDYNLGPYHDWCRRNRTVLGINVDMGHRGEIIYGQNIPLFEAHPEYLALVEGKRTAQYPKFCLSEPAVRKLFVDFAMKWLETYPDQDGVSVEPSDGGNWCECEACQAMGSISTRAVTVANEVAEAVAARYGQGKMVSLQAYFQHALPPTIRVHPSVVITIATRFLPADHSLEQLMAGWQAQGATIGLREYYNVWDWSFDLPGNSSGANTRYLGETIPRFHTMGARYLSAESGDNWGPNGLGYYLASRMLWDVREADRLEELKDDFIEKCFGPARAPMRRFYRMIDGGQNPKISTDLVGRMYRSLAEARALAPDPSIRARLNDLVLYTRYVELHRAFTRGGAGDSQRQDAGEALVRHTYRMRATMMVHEYAVYHQIARVGGMAIPENARMEVPEGENPWKDSTPFGEDEIRQLIEAGISANPANVWEPASYGARLVPSGFPPSDTPGSAGAGTGTMQFYVWADDGVALPAFRASEHAQSGVGWSLYDADGTRLESGSIPHEALPATIAPVTRGPGLFRLDIGSKYFGVDWVRTPGTHVSLFLKPARFMYEWTGYFYVPRGTKTVAIYGLQQVTLSDRAGRPIDFTVAGPTEYTVIPVRPGQDGQPWHALRLCGVHVSFETVPPYFALSPDDLLLPAEVKEAIGNEPPPAERTVGTEP